MVWGKAGSTTLGSAGDVITSSGMTASNFNMVLAHQIATGNLDNIDVTLNNNTNQVYADRESTNGGNEFPQNTQRAWRMSHGDASWDYFNVNYICSITGEEKLLIAQFTSNNGEGNTAPHRNEQVAKFVPNPDAPVTRIDFTNTSGSGSYDTGSNLSALGNDITPADAIPFPTNVELGSRAEITDTRKIYYRMDSDYETDKWFELGTLPYAGGRGVFAGGYSGSNINVIDYITIATTGNATDFGDMTVSRRNSGVCSNKTRGLMCGGYTSSASSNIIDYITIATPSNSTDFGDMDNTVTNGIMGIGSETRALFGGGESSMTNRIAYVTIATPSNSTDFGDLTVARKGGSSTGDGTKGIWMGGEESGQHGVTMDYVTISTTGNATDWGDLSSGTANGSIGLVSNGTIGLLVTGGSYSDRVDKKTIATNANSVDYGDLTDGRSSAGQCSTETRAVFAGGKYQSGGTSSTNIIDYMAIASGGNATDFGDLTASRYIMGGMSDTGAVRP